jgi:hypothetical protein
MRSNSALRAPLLALALTAAAPAHAVLVGPIGFDDMGPVSFAQLDIGTVKFQVDPASYATYGSGFYSWPDYNFVSGSALELTPTGSFGTTLTMTFKSAVTTLAFDLAAPAGDLNNGDVIVQICSGKNGGGSCQALTPPAFSGSDQEQQFFYSGGAIGSATVSYLLGYSASGFSNVDSPLALDNLTFNLTSSGGGGGPGPVIPEPQTYAIFGVGLLMLASALKQRLS